MAQNVGKFESLFSAPAEEPDQGTDRKDLHREA